MARVLAAGGIEPEHLPRPTPPPPPSIVLSTIFAAYGLGLWEAVGRLSATLVAIAVTVALIAALAVWRRRAALGPFRMGAEADHLLRAA